MSEAEEAIRKSTGRVNAPLDFWRCNNYPRHHADRFHSYRNFLNKMDQDVSESEKW